MDRVSWVRRSVFFLQGLKLRGRLNGLLMRPERVGPPSVPSGMEFGTDAEDPRNGTRPLDLKQGWPGFPVRGTARLRQRALLV